MSFKLLLFAVILNNSISYAQINLNVDAAVSNLLRYGNGYEYTGMTKNPKEYFENLTDGRLNVNGVIFGLRYEISDPIEYGLNFIGIRKRYIEYKHESGISFRAGIFGKVFPGASHLMYLKTELLHMTPE